MIALIKLLFCKVWTIMRLYVKRHLRQLEMGVAEALAGRRRVQKDWEGWDWLSVQSVDEGEAIRAKNQE
jgi:hypothetical protein